MTLAMLIVGLLFGIALCLTIAVFAVLSIGGHFPENLKAAAVELRARLTSRNRKPRSSAPARTVETEARMRALQEEIRVMQRLMDQARVDREMHASEMQKATEEISALRIVADDRGERLAAVEKLLSEETVKTGKLRDELADVSAQFARSRQEIKDLETELSLAQSGAGMSAISDEIARLSAERDELSARLERMARPVAVGK